MLGSMHGDLPAYLKTQAQGSGRSVVTVPKQALNSDLPPVNTTPSETRRPPQHLPFGMLAEGCGRHLHHRWWVEFNSRDLLERGSGCPHLSALAENGLNKPKLTESGG